MLDLAQSPDSHTILSASTDRTISLFDLRVSSTSMQTASSTLMHPATPSCIATSSSPHQIVSGAYDGAVRLWDLRNVKDAMTSFKAWDGENKVLAVDWKGGIVGVGGEGGLGVWKVGVQDDRQLS
jgi:ribosome biogenesis protein